MNFDLGSIVIPGKPPVVDSGHNTFYQQVYASGFYPGNAVVNIPPSNLKAMGNIWAFDSSCNAKCRWGWVGGTYVDVRDSIPAAQAVCAGDTMIEKYATAVDEVDLPASLSISQNYPNPFNPTTTISFDLPTSGIARLDVLNVLGQVVATLIDAKLDAGHHSAQWNGHNSGGESVSSGVYFYRLSCSGSTVTRKMMIVK